MLDPLRHPDLLDLERRIRRQFEMVLEAEQAAAFTRHQRQLDLRDRLLEAEEAGRMVAVSTTEGELWTGRIAAVSADHLVLQRAETDAVIMLYQVVAVEIGR